MRLIDADALIERAWRERLDTREQIAEMIDNAPIITDEEVVEEFVRQGVFKKPSQSSGAKEKCIITAKQHSVIRAACVVCR